MVSLLICALFAGGASAEGPGSLDSGGGTRGAGAISVRDALGLAAVGTASADEVVHHSGIVPGLPAATPIVLYRFALAHDADGIRLTWEANSDLRILGFWVERADDRDGEPGPEDYERREAPRFLGPGPHEFVDATVEPGATYYYRLKAAFGIDEIEILGPWSIRVESIPASFRPVIFPASPNPFREATVLRLSLAEPTTVVWNMVDVRGRRVGGGVFGDLAPGYHAVALNPRRRLAAGIYFLRIVAGSMSEVQKLVSLP